MIQKVLKESKICVDPTIGNSNQVKKIKTQDNRNLVSKRKIKIKSRNPEKTQTVKTMLIQSLLTFSAVITGIKNSLM